MSRWPLSKFDTTRLPLDCTKHATDVKLFRCSNQPRLHAVSKGWGSMKYPSRTVVTGVPVGIGLGIPVGTRVGVSVGGKLGSRLGAIVGYSVGCSDGWQDGRGVGSSVGMSVGVEVGDGVGDSVGVEHATCTQSAKASSTTSACTIRGFYQ